ncbi:hypothetical protein PF003_g35324 [Phytophthora fragariae]|nr:hypothetical protein PF003_g35324 [Phytophthora fragariae]
MTALMGSSGAFKTTPMDEMQNTPLSISHMMATGYIGDVLNIKYEEVWSNFGCVFIYVFVFRFLSLPALRYINHQKR